MMTNRLLKALYDELNRAWFSNKLPKDMVVYYADIWQMGVTSYHRERPLYIRISKKLRWTESTSALTLLHEMVHVSLPYRINHGPVFQKKMRSFARRGAMDGWW